MPEEGRTLIGMPALLCYGQGGAWCKHGWSFIGNGQKVQTAILKDGDRLSVGPYVLVFEIANAQHTYKPVIERTIGRMREACLAGNRPTLWGGCSKPGCSIRC